LARLRLLTRLNVARTRLTRLTRLTVRLLARTRLPVGGLSRPAVRRLTRLTVPRGRPIRGLTRLTRLTVLWLTELARIWLPICHEASVGMNSSPAEGSMKVQPCHVNPSAPRVWVSIA
jgi:hypothetical protein